MIKSPKSLTAIVHVKFHYEEEEPRPVSEHEIEMMGRIMSRASEMEPDLQGLMAKFADYLELLKAEEKL